MKYLIYLILLVISLPSYAQDTSIARHKANIIYSWVYESNPLQIYFTLPVAGHPVKIEEIALRDGHAGYDTVRRDYFYEKDKLLRVIEVDNKHIETVFRLAYDDKGRLTLIDELLPGGTYHKDVYEYDTEKPFNVIRKRYVYNKLEEVSKFAFMGNTDSALIYTVDLGPERFRFRKENENMVVEQRERYTKAEQTPDKIQIYDKNDRRTSEKYMEHGALVWHTTIKNDDYGNEMMWSNDVYSNFLGSNGPETYVRHSESHTSFQYDSLGNWVSRHYVQDNHEIILTRKIIYEE